MGLWQSAKNLARSFGHIRITTTKELAEFLRMGSSVTGENITPDTALRISAVMACTRVLSESEAQLPLCMYRRLTPRGKERAPDHYLYPLLHDQPNEWQTAFEFRSMMMAHAVLRGNGYAFINRPRGDEITELLPIHPARVTAKMGPKYQLEYTVASDDGTQQTIPRENMFHLRGLTLDGVTGVSVVEYARDSMGLAMATEKHGGRLFGNGARPSGVLKTPNKLSPEGRKNLKEQWEAQQGGENQLRTAVLEEGLSFDPLSMNSEDAQFLETRQFQITEICRWFRVQPHKIADLSRATFSNIEQQSMEFVTDTLMPWLVRYEQAIRRDLLRPEERAEYFAEHVLDGLLRGDAAGRAAYYRTMREVGAMSANEIRELENRNPRTDAGGDTYLEPANMRNTQQPQDNNDVNQDTQA